MLDKHIEIETGFLEYGGDFGDLCHQTVLPIFAMSQKNMIPLGTGFVIASSGLLMTARHVVEDFVDKKEIRDTGEPIENFRLYVLHVSDKKHPNGSPFAGNNIGGPILITRIYTDPNLDIAIGWIQALHNVENGEPLSFPSVKLGFSAPILDENILGIGYHSSAFSVPMSKVDVSDVKKHVEYSRKFTTTTGTVAEVIGSQGFRKWPHFRSSAKFEPGMSGGPVFLENGSVSGVICSSISGGAEDEGYISYVSEIWPALSFDLDVVLQNGEDPQKLTLLEMVQQNLVKSDDSLKKIETIVNEFGKVVGIKRSL